MIKKHLARNTSKHSAVIPNATLRLVSDRIIVAFNNIEKHDHEEHLVSRELNWLAIEIENRWEILNSTHTTMLMNHLGNLEIVDQMIADTIIHLTLKKCAELLDNTHTVVHFSNQEIAQTFNTLPKLPISLKGYKSLLSLLLNRTLVLVKKEPFSTRDSAPILDAVAKLGIDLLEHRILITKLLSSFERSKESVSELDLTTLHQLWQFCLFAKSTIQSDVLKELLTLVDSELTTRSKQPMVPTKFQKSIYTLILKLLLPSFSEKMKEEYTVGSYSLDIAFPEQKLNIEVDGPYHYWDGKLKRIHRFRDYVLQVYDNWQVIRIPHFEWEKLAGDHQAKLDYLLVKLATHTNLLNITATERLKTLQSTEGQQHSKAPFFTTPKSQSNSSEADTSQTSSTHLTTTMPIT